VFKPDLFLLPTNDPLPFPIIEGFNLNAEPVKIPNDQRCDVKLIGLSLRGGFDYVVSGSSKYSFNYSLGSVNYSLIISQLFTYSLHFS
jgi:hypothetical protein